MSYRSMVWSILSIAVCVYAGLCLFFFIFQRSFIYMPTPATAQHDAAIPLEVPGARLRITTRLLDGPKALVYFGGNAEDVAYTVPELAAAFPDRAIYALHYRGYSGSTGRLTEANLRNDARAVFQMARDRHADGKKVTVTIFATRMRVAVPCVKMVTVTFLPPRLGRRVDAVLVTSTAVIPIEKKRDGSDFSPDTATASSSVGHGTSGDRKIAPVPLFPPAVTRGP